MSLLPSLPATSRLSDLFEQFPDHARPLLVHTEGVMNAGTPLPSQTCELIAAYVSGLNACAFCLGSHTRYAEALGVAPQVIDALIADLDTAPVEPTLRPLLSYVRKLTTLPSRLTQADADAVFAAGWDQTALYHAIQVCALFNLFNRLVEGSGVNYDYADDAATPSDLSADYIGFADRLGL